MFACALMLCPPVVSSCCTLVLYPLLCPHVVSLCCALVLCPHVAPSCCVLMLCRHVVLGYTCAFITAQLQFNSWAVIRTPNILGTGSGLDAENKILSVLKGDKHLHLMGCKFHSMHAQHESGHNIRAQHEGVCLMASDLAETSN